VVGVIISGLAQLIVDANAQAATSTAGLFPGSGQYVSITPVSVLNTQTGVGTGGVVAPMQGGQSISGIQVAGVGNVPQTGVLAAFVNIRISNASGNGYLTDYESDISNPGHASVSFQGSQAASGSDIVQLAPTGSGFDGQIGVTDNGTASANVSIVVEGYFTDNSVATPGSTYIGEQWTDLVDTRSGLGGYSTALGSGQVLSFNPTNCDGYVAGNCDGITASDVASAEILVGALPGATSGSLSIYGSSGANSVPGLYYSAYEKSRVTDIQTPDGNGLIYVKNNGSSSVNVQVVLRGYFLNPTAVEAGSEYVPVTPQTICDTRQGCTYNGVTTNTALAANASITIQETGIGSIPSSGVSEVADEINVVSPTATGWLTVNPANSSSPSSLAALNFFASEGGAVSFDESLVSQTSASGAVTITNVSSGTVQIAVSARGYWFGAQVPTTPIDASSTYGQGSSTVTWDGPLSDGGGDLTGYQLKFSDGTNVTVPASQLSIAQSTTSNATVSISAINGMGIGPSTTAIPVSGVSTENPSTVASAIASAASSQPAPAPMPVCSSEPNPIPAGTISGLVTYGGQPIATETVTVQVDDSTLDNPSYPVLDTVTTDLSGCWWYTAPTSYSSDSSDPTFELPQLLSTNSNVLNLQFTASAIVTVSGVQYPASGMTEQPDSLNTGGNAGLTEQNIVILPLDPSVSGGSITPQIASRLVSHRLAESGNLAANAAYHQLQALYLHRVDGNSQLRSGLKAGPYGLISPLGLSPYDVNGHNLLRARAKPAQIAQVEALLPTHTRTWGPVQIRLHQRLNSRVAARPQGLAPMPDGGAGLPYCLSTWDATGGQAPAGSQCVKYCTPAGSMTSIAYSWQPAGDVHLFVAQEKGSISEMASASTTVSVQVEGGIGGILSANGGRAQEQSVGAGVNVPFFYANGAYDELLLPVKYTGVSHENDCITVGLRSDQLSFLQSQTAAAQIYYETPMIYTILSAYGIWLSGTPNSDPGAPADEWLVDKWVHDNWSSQSSAILTSASSQPVAQYPNCSVPGQYAGFLSTDPNRAADCKFVAPDWQASNGGGRSYKKSILYYDTQLTSACSDGSQSSCGSISGDGWKWQAVACALQDYGALGANANAFTKKGVTTTYQVGATLKTPLDSLFSMSISTTFSWSHGLASATEVYAGSKAATAANNYGVYWWMGQASHHGASDVINPVSASDITRSPALFSGGFTKQINTGPYGCAAVT